MKEKTIQFIKQLQTELDNRTKVEEKAQDLMKNGKFKEATELLFDLSVKEEVKAGYKDFLNKKYEEFKLFLNQKGFCPDSEEEVWKMYGKAFNKSSGACNFAKDMIQIQQYDETGKLNELDIFLNEIQRKYLSCCEDYITSMDSKEDVQMWIGTKILSIADKYADLVEKRLQTDLNEPEIESMTIQYTNNKIRMLNYTLATLERIKKLESTGNFVSDVKNNEIEKLNNLEVKVLSIADKYADLVEKRLQTALNEPEAECTAMQEIDDGIKMLNHIAAALEKIKRLVF